MKDRQYTPLVTSIVEDAVEDFVKGPGKPGKTYRWKAWRHAVWFFFGNRVIGEKSWRGDDLLEYLDICPDQIRSHLRERVSMFAPEIQAMYHDEIRRASQWKT